MNVDGENEINCWPHTVVHEVDHCSSVFGLWYIRFLLIRIQLRAQAPVHETSFLERHPPLAWFTRSVCV